MIEVLVIQIGGDNDLLINGEYKPFGGLALAKRTVHDTLMHAAKIIIADGQKFTLEETPR